jgi:histidinol dehydrogenase
VSAWRLRPRLRPEDLAGRPAGVPGDVLTAAGEIVARVRTGGEPALRDLTVRFGERRAEDPLVLERPALHAALEALHRADRARLERVAARIAAFARAQRDTLRPLRVPIPGGWAGHELAPVERAACYVPGGRYPLPSTALMTVLAARTAGVAEVWVATPRPAGLTLAAAALAGADAVLVAGGAHAVAALAYGAGPVPSCDVIVGPGNRYVAAAKLLVSDRVGIDFLAGPSELVILADAGADPCLIAADLLAQAEHDPHALPVLVTTSAPLADAVEGELARQLAALPAAAVARDALRQGGAAVCDSMTAACDLVATLAPEHLEVMVRDDSAIRPRLRHFGALFLGAQTAEVLGDYGAGPNHTLPTGRAARATGGLSPLTFLRARTWMRIDDPAAARELLEDAAWLARREGLEGHARAAEFRLAQAGPMAG